jgi:hypothetical protein
MVIKHDAQKTKGGNAPNIPKRNIRVACKVFDKPANYNSYTNTLPVYVILMMVQLVRTNGLRNNQLRSSP